MSLPASLVYPASFRSPSALFSLRFLRLTPLGPHSCGVLAYFRGSAESVRKNAKANKKGNQADGDASHAWLAQLSAGLRSVAGGVKREGFYFENQSVATAGTQWLFCGRCSKSLGVCS